MSSTVYNHRSLQPSGPVASAPQPLGLTAQHRDLGSHSLQRLTDSLEAIRSEFDVLARDATILRQERDEYEAKLNAQINELNLIRQTLYELETSHSKYRQQYEEEISKLRNELHSTATRQSGTTPSGSSRDSAISRDPVRPTSSSQMPYPDYYRDRPSALERDRERERLTDRDRDRIADSRDPKRLKVDPTGRRPDFMPSVNSLPKMPPLTPSSGAGGSSSLGDRITSPKSSWREPGASPKVSINPGPPTINLGRDPRDSPGDGRDNGRDRELAVVRRPQTPTPIVLADLDPHSMPPDLRTEASDWFCIFNPNLPPSSLLDPKKRKNLEINLVWTLNHPTVVCCVQFSADGKYLATGCNRTAQIYDVKNGNKICILTDDTAGNTGDLYIRSVRFSPDGRYLATGAEDKRIRIWDIARKKIVVTFNGHSQEIYALDFTPDGRSIVSGSGDKTARIWNLEPFLTPTGGHASPTAPPNPDDPRYCMILTITDSPSAPGLQLSSSTNGGDNGTGDSNATDAGVTSVAVSPDGKFLAAGSLDCLVRIWDIKTGALLERLQGHQNSVYSVVFTPNGRGVISGSLDRTMKYWDVSWLYSGGPKPPDGGKCVMNFAGHKDYVLSVAVSHDSQWIVSGSKDRGVQFWDARNAQVQCMLQGHKNSVISIALNPVANVLASGSGDNLARIWRYKTVVDGLRPPVDSLRP